MRGALKYGLADFTRRNARGKIGDLTHITASNTVAEEEFAGVGLLFRSKNAE